LNRKKVWDELVKSIVQGGVDRRDGKEEGEPESRHERYRARRREEGEEEERGRTREDGEEDDRRRRKYRRREAEDPDSDRVRILLSVVRTEGARSKCRPSLFSPEDPDSARVRTYSSYNAV